MGRRSCLLPCSCMGIILLALGILALAAGILYFYFQIDVENLDFSETDADVRLGKLAKAVTDGGGKAELVGRAEVSPESPKAVIGGASVDFGEYNLKGEATLELARLPTQSDPRAGVQADTYRLTLGEVKEFPTMVEVTLPYDPAGLSQAEQAGAISIAWLDKANLAWKVIPAKVDTATRAVTFRTSHFSEFAVLKNTLSKGKTLFYYPGDTYRGPETPIRVDFGALQKTLENLDTSPFQRLISERAEPTNEYLSSGMGLVNTLSSGGDHATTFNQFAGGAFPMITGLQKTVGNAFTAVGAAAIAFKMADQWNRGVSGSRIVRDNTFSLLELVASGVVIVKASPFAAVCAAGIWTAGIVDNVMATDELKRYHDLFDRLHDQFNQQCVTYHRQSDSWGYHVPVPGRGMPNTRFMVKKGAWATEVNAIYQANRHFPQRIKPEVEKFIEQFSDVFWRVAIDHRRRSDILYWADQSGLIKPERSFFGGTRERLAKDLDWPGDFAATLKYRQACRTRTHNRLLPLYKLMAEKEQREIWDTYQKRIFDLAEELNQTMVFEVHDPDLRQPGFAKSAHADKLLCLHVGGSLAKDFHFEERHADSNRVFACNLYHYIAAGMPDEFRIYPAGAREDSPHGHMYSMEESVKFTATSPLTVISLPTTKTSGAWHLTTDSSKRQRFAPNPRMASPGFKITSSAGAPFISWVNVREEPLEVRGFAGSTAFHFDADASTGKLETMVKWHERIYLGDTRRDVDFVATLSREWKPGTLPKRLVPGAELVVTETVEAKFEPSDIISRSQFVPVMTAFAESFFGGGLDSAEATSDCGNRYSRVSIGRGRGDTDITSRTIRWRIPEGSPGQTMAITLRGKDNGRAGLGHSAGRAMDNFQSGSVRYVYEFR